MFYNLTPAQYAAELRESAERSDRSADRYAVEGKPWSAGEEKYMRRQSRRLRAMATLCDRSTATRAGEVDFLGLHDPTREREREDEIVAGIEAAA